MLPVERLLEEHQLIRQCLDQIQAAFRMMERGIPVPWEFFEQLIAFAREYVHRYHHFKEEYQLFPLVARKVQGPFRLHLAFLRNQHEQGQQTIDEIEEAMSASAVGKPDGNRALRLHLKAFHTLLSEHILKEHEIFPLIQETLSEEELTRLEEEFALVDDVVGAEFVARNHERVRTLSLLLSSARHHLAPPEELLLPDELAATRRI